MGLHKNVIRQTDRQTVRFVKMFKWFKVPKAYLENKNWREKIYQCFTYKIKNCKFVYGFNMNGKKNH